MKRFALILAALGSVASPTACALTAGGLILSLSGNTGNAAILNMRQTFGADFTPAAEGGVPEPSTWRYRAGGWRRSECCGAGDNCGTFRQPARMLYLCEFC